MLRLDSYKTIFERDTVQELELLAERLKGLSVLHVNSTAIGGGVAELLNRIVPMNRELGVDMRWEVMKGGEDFYAVTKKFHNALHGRRQEFSARDFEVSQDTVEQNLAQMDLDADIVFIHDPQPLGFVKRRKKRPGSRWIWRCHIDLSHPQAEVWDRQIQRLPGRFLRRLTKPKGCGSWMKTMSASRSICARFCSTVS
jgi:trehalose synthase